MCGASGVMGVVKRGAVLAAVAAVLVAAGAAEAEKYVISAGSSNEMFSVRVSNNLISGGANVPIDTAISIIRKGADGEAVEINFDTTGGGVSLGKKSIVIGRKSGVDPSWGKLTLSGSVRSSGEGYDAVLQLLADDKDTLTLDVKSSLNIKIDTLTRGGISVRGAVRLTLDNCDISTVGGKVINVESSYAEMKEMTIMGGKFESKKGTVVYGNGNINILGGTFATGGAATIENYENIKITGGKFAATAGGRALNVLRGTVRISGEAEFSTAETDTGAAVVLDGGNVVLADGVIKNILKSGGGALGCAISIPSAQSTLTFTGGAAPEISGSIRFRVHSTICMENVEPSWKSERRSYVLEPISGARVDGAIAVRNGGQYFSSFEYVNDYYEIERNDKNIVIKLKDNVQQLKYVITGDAIKGFTAIEDYSKVTIGTNLEFSSIFSAMRIHANGRPCGMFFGKGGATLDIGTASIQFFGSYGDGWGRVTLFGKVRSHRSDNARAPTFVVWVREGASVVNEADIGGTQSGGVLVTEGSDYTHVDGTLELQIDNGHPWDASNGGKVTVLGGKVPLILSRGRGAEVNISGGTVGDSSRYDCAIKNERYSEVYISNGATIISADTGAQGGTIVNSGVLEIYGGSISNVKTNYYGQSVAINNYDDKMDTTVFPEVYITGTAKVFSKSANAYTGVIRNDWGRMTISGGEVYSTADTVGTIVHNNGELVISGSAKIRSGSYNPTVDAGVVHSSHYDEISKDEPGLAISGGTIVAKDGYAVSVNAGGGAIISEDAVVTSADPEGAVYIGAGGYLKLVGGTVSSTANASDTSIKMIKAIDAYVGGRGGSAGRLMMGGSPMVNGIISLPASANLPISVLAVDSRYPFKPNGKTYCVATTVTEDGVVLKNGAGFVSNFALDTAGNKGFNLAVDGNDVIATTGRTYNVKFSFNGAATMDSPPAPIPVKKEGTIGELAKPAVIVKNYIVYDTLSNGIEMIENDGVWHIREGGVSGKFEDWGDEFRFGVGNDGTEVAKELTLTLSWTGKKTFIPVSVQESPRDLPAPRPAVSVSVAPPVSSAGALTAGPSPVSAVSGGAVSFFRSGAPLRSGKLSIYDASGDMVAAVAVSDPSSGVGRRPVAKWDLQCAGGRKAAEGTYVARGVVVTKAGKSERVSVLVNVRR